jgi:hypothetical protein
MSQFPTLSRPLPTRVAAAAAAAVSACRRCNLAPLFTQRPHINEKVPISPPHRTMEWFEFLLCFGSHALILSFFDFHTLMSNPHVTAASLLLPVLFYRLLSSPMIVTRCLSDVPPPHLLISLTPKITHPPPQVQAASFTRVAPKHMRGTPQVPLSQPHFPFRFERSCSRGRSSCRPFLPAGSACARLQTSARDR